jgi:L-malate glycosyltransferase
MSAAHTERVRLMQLTTIFAIGGTERQLVNLAKGIDPRKFELHLACLRRWGSFLEELRDLEHPIAEFSISSLYDPRTLGTQVDLARHLRRNRIQVFHAQGFYPDVFGIPAALLAGTPVTITSVRDQGDSRTRIQELALRAACALSDAVVVNAEVVKRGLVEQGYSAQKIHVIYNGVDAARFAPDRRSAGHRAALFGSLGIPPDSALVIALCRLSPVKGLEALIDAAALLASRSPKARLLIVGDAAVQPGARDNSDYRRELEQRVARLGLCDRVRFSGFRLDVPQLLAEAQVSVLSSHSEALSNTLLESMAAGVPVVATRVGGNPEAVEEGVTGLLVPPRDAEALAEAIQGLLERPALAAQFGQAGRERVRRLFSIEQLVQRTEQLYQSLLAAATRPSRQSARLAREPAAPRPSNAP